MKCGRRDLTRHTRATDNNLATECRGTIHRALLATQATPPPKTDGGLDANAANVGAGL